MTRLPPEERAELRRGRPEPAGEVVVRGGLSLADAALAEHAEAAERLAVELLALPGEALDHGAELLDRLVQHVTVHYINYYDIL